MSNGNGWVPDHRRMSNCNDRVPGSDGGLPDFNRRLPDCNRRLPHGNGGLPGDRGLGLAERARNEAASFVGEHAEVPATCAGFG